MSANKELLEVCTDMIRLIEGVGCKDWRNQNGMRIKDTNEWARAYVVINNALSDARKEAQSSAPVPAQPSAMPVCGYCERPFSDREICQVCTTGEQPSAVAQPAWIGCGECDCNFTCHDGKTACIRNPHEEQPAPAVADGYVLVPKEPTAEMLKAAGVYQDKCAMLNYGGHADADGIWDAMLDAAQEKPE